MTCHHRWVFSVRSGLGCGPGWVLRSSRTPLISHDRKPGAAVRASSVLVTLLPIRSLFTRVAERRRNRPSPSEPPHRQQAPLLDGILTLTPPRAPEFEESRHTRRTFVKESGARGLTDSDLNCDLDLDHLRKPPWCQVLWRPLTGWPGTERRSGWRQYFLVQWSPRC